MVRTIKGLANEESAGSVKLTDDIDSREKDTVLSMEGVGKLTDTFVKKDVDIFHPKVKFAMWMEHGKLCKYQRDKTKQLIEVNGKETSNGTTIDTPKGGFRAHLDTVNNSIYIGAPLKRKYNSKYYENNAFTVTPVGDNKYKIDVNTIITSRTTIVGLFLDNFNILYKGRGKMYRAHFKVSSSTLDDSLFGMRINELIPNIVGILKTEPIDTSIGGNGSISLVEVAEPPKDAYYNNRDETPVILTIESANVGDTFTVEAFVINNTCDHTDYPNFNGGRLIINENPNDSNYLVIGGKYLDSNVIKYDFTSTVTSVIKSRTCSILSSNKFVVPYGDEDIKLTKDMSVLDDFNDNDILNDGVHRSFITQGDNIYTSSGLNKFSEVTSSSFDIKTDDGIPIYSCFNNSDNITDDIYAMTPFNRQHFLRMNDEISNKLQEFKAIILFDTDTDRSTMEEIHDQFIEDGEFNLIKDEGFNAYYPTVTTKPDYMGNIIGNKVKVHPLLRYVVYGSGSNMLEYTREDINGVIRYPNINSGKVAVQDDIIYGNTDLKDNALYVPTPSNYNISDTTVTRLDGDPTAINIKGTVVDNGTVENVIVVNTLISSADLLENLVVANCNITNNSDESYAVTSNNGIFMELKPKSVTKFIVKHIGDNVGDTQIQIRAINDISNIQNPSAFDITISDVTVRKCRSLTEHHSRQYNYLDNKSRCREYISACIIDDTLDIEAKAKNYIINDIIDIYGDSPISGKTLTDVLAQVDVVGASNQQSIDLTPLGKKVLVERTRTNVLPSDNYPISYLCKNNSLKRYSGGVEVIDDDYRYVSAYSNIDYSSPTDNEVIFKEFNNTMINTNAKYGHNGFGSVLCFDAGLSDSELEYQNWLFKCGMLDFTPINVDAKLEILGKNDIVYDFSLSEDNSGYDDNWVTGSIIRSGNNISLRLQSPMPMTYTDYIAKFSADRDLFNNQIPKLFTPMGRVERGNSTAIAIIGSCVIDNLLGYPVLYHFNGIYNTLKENAYLFVTLDSTTLYK